jgi:hypothetical protein
VLLEQWIKNVVLLTGLLHAQSTIISWRGGLEVSITPISVLVLCLYSGGNCWSPLWTEWFIGIDPHVYNNFLYLYKSGGRINYNDLFDTLWVQRIHVVTPLLHCMSMVIGAEGAALGWRIRIQSEETILRVLRRHTHPCACPPKCHPPMIRGSSL